MRINFAPNQQLPPNFEIHRIDDHYVWQYGALESVIFCDRWDCWRSAHLKWKSMLEESSKNMQEAREKSLERNRPTAELMQKRISQGELENE